MRDPTPTVARRFIDVLRDWCADGPPLDPSRDPLMPVHLHRAREDVVKRLGELVPRMPPIFELEALERSLREAWSRHQSIEGVSPRSLRRAPWVFFFPPKVPERWLGADRGFVTAWLRWFEANRRSRVAISLLREFLMAYPLEAPTFDEIRRSLSRVVASGGSPRLQRWNAISQRYGTLKKNGPGLLVESWWDGDAVFDDYLRSAGLSPGLEGSAFVERATLHLLGIVHKRLGRNPSIDWLDRATTWLGDGDELRFDSLRVDTAEAFLEPFLERSPNAEVQEAIRVFLCRAIGDPRTRRGRWQGVPEAIRNVLFRWLVALSLEDFFHVLDRTALDRHWRYRKAFWSAYLERKVISDAWIVLGPNARRLLRKRIAAQSSGAAELIQAGSDQSVLLMKIGDLTIAEWSHNGTCRIWRSGNKSAPRIYGNQYSRSQLVRGCDWDQRHHGSEAGRWQYRVEDFIRRETGIRISSRDYMP